jgi:hypothetical protein
MGNALLQKELSAEGGICLQDTDVLRLYPTTLPESLESPTCAEIALCRYLQGEIFPQFAPPPYGEIEVRKLSEQKPVYLFHEKTKNIIVVGKLFQHRLISREEAWLCARKEYFNLKLLRDRFGMSDDACHVVAPLGKNKELSALLVTAKAPGRLLDYYIEKAVADQQSEQLIDKLTDLAGFLVKLHRNSEIDGGVSLDLAQAYLCELLDSLSEGPLGPCERKNIETHAAAWWDKNGILSADKQVIVHGDATPTNFLFDGQEVIGIDLERMKRADRCWDLGFMVAELKHHFMWRMGNGWAAEPFIGHFLWEYALNYGGAQFFNAITRRVPLYMALGLLRIARNSWLDEPYRKDLLSEAKRCLKYGL